MSTGPCTQGTSELLLLTNKVDWDLEGVFVEEYILRIVYGYKYLLGPENCGWSKIVKAVNDKWRKRKEGDLKKQ